MLPRSFPRARAVHAHDIHARQLLARAAASGPRTVAESTPAWHATRLADILTPDRNSFGVIRLALALAVLVSHAVYLTVGKTELEPLYRWTGYSLGQHGVQAFFILSGILVAQSLFQSRSVRDYAIARALRIFPGLIVCVLLTALLLGPALTELSVWAYLKDTRTAAYILKTTGLVTGSAELPGLFASNVVPRAINTSVWTLKYEVLCYALLAAAGALVIKVSDLRSDTAWRVTAYGLAATWLVLALAVPAGIEAHAGPKSMLQVLHYFTVFFGVGVLGYAGRHWIPVHAALLLPLGALWWLGLGTRFNAPMTAVFLGYAAVWFATFRFGRLRAFCNGNDYSYATYLYHYPIAQTVLHLFPGMQIVTLIGLTAGVVLPLAYLSWELVERPALRLRKVFGRSPSPSAPHRSALAV